MTNRWRRFVWLSIGINYQYQSIDKLVSIGCRLMESELTQKKHKFVRSNCQQISFSCQQENNTLLAILNAFPRSPLFLFAVNTLTPPFTSKGKDDIAFDDAPIFSKASTQTSCGDILTQKGNDVTFEYTCKGMYSLH